MTKTKRKRNPTRNQRRDGKTEGINETKRIRRKKQKDETNEN